MEINCEVCLGIMFLDTLKIFGTLVNRNGVVVNFAQCHRKVGTRLGYCLFVSITKALDQFNSILRFNECKALC